MNTAIIDEYSEQGRELREHGTAAFPVACYSGDWRETSVHLHWHGELEAGFVTAGQVTMLVGRERITLDTGDGFFINSGIPHAVISSEGKVSSQRSVVFDPMIVGGRPDSVFWQRYVQPVVSAASMPFLLLRSGEPWQRNAVARVEQVWTCCDQGREEYELTVRSELSGFLSLLKDHIPAEHPAQDRRIARDNERIRTMMGHIQSHYTEPLTAEQIARSAMISVSEALRCFHNTIGMTPIQYLKYYRIQQAAAQLQNSGQKIAEIGAACGFQEMSYFAKTFREIMGQTPGQYRGKFR